MSTLREPPVFDDEEAKGSLWSSIPDRKRTRLIRSWVTVSWPSLSVFCRAYDLDYESVRRAFATRGVPVAATAQTPAGDPVRARYYASNLYAQIAHSLSGQIDVLDDIRPELLRKLESSSTKHFPRLLREANQSVRVLGSLATELFPALQDSDSLDVGPTDDDTLLTEAQRQMVKRLARNVVDGDADEQQPAAK